MKKNGNIGKDLQAETALDQLTEQYIQDPDRLSLEEKQKIYQHWLMKVEGTSEEAEILHKAINEVKRDLEYAKQGDPGFITTPQGTYLKLDVELKMVPVDQLISDTDCLDLFRNMEGEDFEQLKASIREIGLIEPIVVNPKMRVMCGRQRLRAAQAIRLANIPVLIRSVSSEQMWAILAIEENIRRRQLQPSEMARSVKKLVELKNEKNCVIEVAKEIGFSKSHTYRYRDLSFLMPEISSLMDRGRLTQETATQIAQMDEEVQRVLYQALGERISEQKVVEFKRDNADLIKQVERLTAQIKRIEQREAKLESENAELLDRVEQAELKTTKEFGARTKLEEELQHTRAEKYREVQKRQAIIDKLCKNAEPKVVPPPDYAIVKKELKELKAKWEKPPDIVMSELYGILAGRVLLVDLETYSGKLSQSVRELFSPLIPELKTWINRLEELIRYTPTPSPTDKSGIKSTSKEKSYKDRGRANAE